MTYESLLISSLLVEDASEALRDPGRHAKTLIDPSRNDAQLNSPLSLLFM